MPGRARIPPLVYKIGVPALGVVLVGNACFFESLIACLAFGSTNIRAALIVLLASYPILHVLSVVASLAHAFGIVREHGATSYFVHMVGPAATVRTMHLWALLLLAVLLGPAYTAYALLAPVVRSLAARDAEKDGTSIGPIVPGATPAPNGVQPIAPLNYVLIPSGMLQPAAQPTQPAGALPNSIPV